MGVKKVINRRKDEEDVKCNSCSMWATSTMGEAEGSYCCRKCEEIVLLRKIITGLKERIANLQQVAEWECHSLGCAVQDAITFSKPNITGHTQDAITFSKPNITGHTPIQPSLNKPEGGCPRKWKLFNNKCYLVHTERKDYKGWGTARESCKEKGGDLVSITNADEQMFLLTQLEQVHIRSWIGLNDIDEEGNFVWSDGTPVTYTNWVARRPFPSPQDLLYQSDCVAMMNFASIGSWRDEICDYKAAYVCQKATDPTIAVTNPPPVTELALFGKSLFWVDMISQPFAEARKVCQRSGSEIASLISVYEQAFVSLLAQQAGGELWIGLKRNETNGAYNWLDGRYMHMTGWAKDQLDQSQACVSLVAGEGWMDVSCSKHLPVVCKKSIEPPPTDTSLRGVCSSAGGYWQMFQHSCFTFHSSPKISWMGAAVTCSKLGGSLVSLRNKDESLFLQRKIKRFHNKTESFWIGLHLDDNGCLAWLDGSSTSYNRLWPLHKQGGSRDASTEGERCVTISSKDFSWKEHSCTGRFGFICRKSGAEVIENGTKTTKGVLSAHLDGKIRHNAGCEDRRTFIFRNPNITTLTPIQPSLNMPQGGCPWKWKLFNNKCYLPITQRADHKSWKHAQDSCKAEGGDLVSITNVDEQMFLLTQLEDFELKCWIGLNDINEEGNFVWSDGTPVNYTHWDNGRPFISQQYFSYESDCVVMLNYESIGSWRENRCDFKRGYICKMATDPTIAPTKPAPLTELVPFGKSMFQVDPTPRPFAEARAACRRNGSDIASVISVYEHAFVSLLARRAGGALWIGLNAYETAGAYRWLDDWYMPMTWWATDEPAQSQACVHLVAGEGWKTESCLKNLPVVCKKSPEPPPTPVPGACPSTSESWQKSGDACFLFQSDKLSWMGAAVTCSRLGSSLVSWTNSFESDIVEGKIKFPKGEAKRFWIGLHHSSDGLYSWLDGSSTRNSTNLQHLLKKHGIEDPRGAGAERCIAISSQDFSWKEKSCTDPAGYICRASVG